MKAKHNTTIFPDAVVAGTLVLPSVLARRWKIWAPYASLESRQAGNPSIEEYRKIHEMRFQQLTRVGITLERIRRNSIDNPVLSNADWDEMFVYFRDRRIGWNKLGERQKSVRLYKFKRTKGRAQEDARREKHLCHVVKLSTIGHLADLKLSKLY